MSNEWTPALTPEQWEAKDYRQSARELDRWAQARPGAPDDDATEYAAKLGLDESGSVIVMSRAHERVLVPPPARAALAAFALAGEPFGFTEADVRVVQRAAEKTDDAGMRDELRSLAGRLQALLPPAGTDRRS